MAKNDGLFKVLDPCCIHISMGGNIYFISENSKKWMFEDHPTCGPVVLNKNGDPLNNQPGEMSKFWEIVSLWYAQGKQTKQVNNENWCIWEKPTMPKMRHIGGNNYELVTT